MVGVSACAHCPSLEARHVLSGERLCGDCASATLVAATVDVGGRPGLVHELPIERPGRSRPRQSGPQRDTRRSRAERAAVSKLKLTHLGEFNAIYAAELHAVGLQPVAAASFDVHLRKLAGTRLAALAQRTGNA